jgi:hypothetical protein
LKRLGNLAHPTTLYHIRSVNSMGAGSGVIAISQGGGTPVHDAVTGMNHLAQQRLHHDRAVPERRSIRALISGEGKGG